MYVYIAGPLFSEGERWFNSRLKQTLIDQDIDSFLPQEDGILVSQRIKQGENVEKIMNEVYQLDIKKLNQCDLLIAVLDGAVIDEGTAFEVGYFKALNKPCIGFQTDSRRQLPQGNNPMIEGSLDCVIHSLSEMSSYLTQLRVLSSTQ